MKIVKSLLNTSHRIGVIKNIFWMFFDKLFRMLLGLVVGLYVARHLGPANFGLLNYSSAIVGFCTVFAGLGLNSIIVRELILKPDEKEIILGTSAILQLGSGIISYFISIALVYYIRPNDNLALFVVSILGTSSIFKFSEISSSWFEAHVSSKFIVWVQNLCFFLFSILKFLLVFSNCEFEYFVSTMGVEVIVLAFFMLFVLNFKGIRLSSLSASFKTSILLLKESWPLMLSSFAILFYMKIDQVMISHLINDEAVGVYSAAVRISEVWYFIPLGIVVSLTPSLIKQKTVNGNLYNLRFQQLYGFMVWLAILVAIIVSLSAKPLVISLFGVDYIKASNVLVVHIWTGIFVFLGMVSSQWFLAENKNLMSFWRVLSGMIINITLNIFLIPKYGIQGAAFATLISQAMATFLFDAFMTETRMMFIMKVKAFNPFGVIKSFSN